MDQQATSNEGLESRLLQYEKVRRRKSSERLKPLEMLVLRKIVQGTEITEHDLILTLKLLPPSLSRTITGLVRKNLVQRVIDTQDGRRRVLRPTPQSGAKLAEADLELQALIGNAGQGSDSQQAGQSGLPGSPTTQRSRRVASKRGFRRVRPTAGQLPLDLNS